MDSVVNEWFMGFIGSFVLDVVAAAREKDLLLICL